MNQFLRKTVLFFAILSGFAVAAFLILDYTNTEALAEYRVDPKVTTAFMGDSHIQCAINDELLANGKSFAQSAEALYFTYYKMEALLQHNPSIKKVYLGFGCHNISTHYDEFVSGEFSKDIAPKYFYTLPLKEKLFIIRHNKKDLFSLLESILHNGWRNKNLYKTNSLLGHYENYFINCAATKSSMDKRIETQFYKNGQLRGFSAVNIKYFTKIVQLCRSRNVALVVLNTPLHPYYKNKIPTKFINEYNTLMTENNLKPFDFSMLILNDSSYVPDGDHISAKGSPVTTALFKE
jgi:hypothetical protein